MKIKNIHYLIKYRTIKHMIANKDYKTNRMQKMAEDIIYWKTMANNSTINIQRNYCKQMEELFYKRFMFYKNT